MRVQLHTSAAALRLLTVTLLLGEASSHGHIDTHLAKRHHQLDKRQPRPAPPVPAAFMNNRRSCKRGESESSTLFSTTSAAPSATSAEATNGSSPTSRQPSSSSSSSSSSGDTGSVAAGGFNPVKPKDWPTATQSGAIPTRTSAADQYLEKLSDAIDNSGNPFFTESHTGEMTYYYTGKVACGDQYDDKSFTAAVSLDMYDNWPGFNGQDNQNPICGPYVPARKILNEQGTFDSVPSIKTSVAGFAAIGGDGILACPLSINVSAQCHIPLTATVTHGGKTIQVQIVDRCTACKVNDIDLTPAAFIALAGSLEAGRTGVTWKFDNW
ncbi:hypothetical protein C8R46DRAFT_649613 [Mycena filopes]|nr:hypothetical protein C8R46DRAFT_649613 [Mycena filopes]